MSGHIPRLRDQRPIFVGASARRLRGLRTAGAMVLVSAVGFVGVLLIALVAGLLLPSLVLPFAAPPKTVVSPVQPQPTPQPATSTTADPLRVSVVLVDLTRQLSGLAPPRAASPLAPSRRRPPNATVKVATEHQGVPKRRPVMVAKATPKGVAVKRRLAVAALQVTARGRQTVRPAAKSGPVAKGRPASGVTAKGKAAAKAEPFEPPKSLKLPLPQSPPIRAGR